MTIVPLALAQRSNQTRYGVEGAARLINCYAEELGGDAKSPMAIYPIEGMDSYLTPYEGGIKCLLETESYLYGVAGTKVFAIDATSDVVTICGTLPVEAPCYMARNRRNPTTQVGLVSNGLYYVIENTTLTQINDPDLPPPTSISVRDGYFILPTTFGRYFITGEDDATTISALDFGTAQRNPDTISRVIASETDIVLFGPNSIEWHQNQPSSTASFPFVPVASIEIGLINSDAVAKVNRDIIWAASDGTIRRMNGYGGEIISTPAVERAIGFVDPETITAFAWNVRDAGKTFVAFRSDSFCWVFDLDGGSGWHERASYSSPTWRANAAVNWGADTLFGDASTGTLYRVSKNTHSEGGYPIVMTVQTPPLDASPYPLTVYGLNVDIVPGTGLNTPSAPETLDPELIMDYSDDGGTTWSTARRAALGRQGQTMTRVAFNRLGMIRRNGRTFRFRISSSVARAITGATVDVTKETA